MTTNHEEQLREVRSWVGRSHAEMKCWELVQRAWSLRGVSLPNSYYSAMDVCSTVLDPEPWDIVPICNHRLAIANHVGLYLGNGQFIHSMEETGITIADINRRWIDRVAIDRLSGKHGFLRVRGC